MDYTAFLSYSYLCVSNRPFSTKTQDPLVHTKSNPLQHFNHCKPVNMYSFQLETNRHRLNKSRQTTSLFKQNLLDVCFGIFLSTQRALKDGKKSSSWKHISLNKSVYASLVVLVQFFTLVPLSVGDQDGRDSILMQF